MSISGFGGGISQMGASGAASTAGATYGADYASAASQLNTATHNTSTFLRGVFQSNTDGHLTMYSIIPGWSKTSPLSSYSSTYRRCRQRPSVHFHIKAYPIASSGTFVSSSAVHKYPSTGQFFFDDETLAVVAATIPYDNNSISWNDRVTNEDDQCYPSFESIELSTQYGGFNVASYTPHGLHLSVDGILGKDEAATVEVLEPGSAGPLHRSQRCASRFTAFPGLLSPPEWDPHCAEKHPTNQALRRQLATARLSRSKRFHRSFWMFTTKVFPGLVLPKWVPLVPSSRPVPQLTLHPAQTSRRIEGPRIAPLNPQAQPASPHSFADTPDQTRTRGQELPPPLSFARTSATCSIRLSTPSRARRTVCAAGPASNLNANPSMPPPPTLATKKPGASEVEEDCAVDEAVEAQDHQENTVNRPFIPPRPTIARPRIRRLLVPDIYILTYSLEIVPKTWTGCYLALLMRLLGCAIRTLIAAGADTAAVAHILLVRALRPRGRREAAG
ncbi:hypothetical protein DFH09DRAFT_1319408 [Mycena vulgaris]|nr:hypothetical protein DFH09DRAFT_1319408 [Mycena vulgaris]